MPWKGVTVLDLRREFVMLARSAGSNVSELCKRFEISRNTGHKWLKRFGQQGMEGLENRSRRPTHSPKKTAAVIEGAVLAVRQAHGCWGGRKIRRTLHNQGFGGIPAPSTITSILRRHNQLDPQEALKHTPVIRFERAAPNELWQMDFKGHVPCPEGRCHPLTVLDDPSRYAIALRACADERGATVRANLMNAFRHYGLPWQMLMDNGSPWGSDREHPHTPLTVWLMRLGIRITHGRAYHPQTQGKEERFHRTLKAELLGLSIPWPQSECEQRFEQWRHMYNWQRPHEALALNVPGSRYRTSSRAFPETLPPIEYGPEDQVRSVQHGGHLSYNGHDYRISKAFRGQPVAVRPRAQEDGILDVFFCQQRIATFTLKDHV